MYIYVIIQKIKNNKEIILRDIKQNRYVLNYDSNILINNKKFLIECIEIMKKNCKTLEITKIKL